MPQRHFLHFSPRGAAPPPAFLAFAEATGRSFIGVDSADDLLARVGRAYPEAILLDATAEPEVSLPLCRNIKSEPFTAVVPVVAYVDDGAESTSTETLEAGADEVLRLGLSERETHLRLEMALRRADRDVSVHPTTRLPGTVRIERDIVERLQRGEIFAVCYADLDHFKEFNDRYGYNHGDRVILVLSRILRDVVRARSPRGFVGHIGGDDFIFTVPFADLDICCREVIEVFEELIPLQYTPEDQGRGSFLGKDRRGHPYEVPLITLSIGVVTNNHRSFAHVAEISELATEMKAYAKTLPGSVHAVDRRAEPSRG